MNAIVAADQNWAIARESGLLFFLPCNLNRFLSLTRGGTVIMDSRMLHAFPEGRPPEGRRSIVISRDDELSVDRAEIVPSAEAALSLAGGPEAEDLWVIGGGSVYTALLSRCGRVFLTSVDARIQDTDSFFPNLDKLCGWELDSAGAWRTDGGISYRLMEYVNTKL